MASSINADNGVVSGSSGLKSTADTSGVLALQSNGTTALSVGTDLNVTLTNPLPVASGGTNSTATPTAGGVGYGTGTAHAYTSAGTSGQVLTSSGSGAPTWTTPSSGAIGTDMSYVDYLLTTSSPLTSAAGAAIYSQSVSLDGTSELMIIHGSSSAHAVVFNSSTNTFGTPVLVRTAALNPVGTVAVKAISATSVLVCSLPSSTTSLETVVLTISGTTITVGTPVATTLAAASDLNTINTRLVTVGSSYVLNYYNSSGTTPKFRAITVSGSTPTVGAELAYTAGGTSNAQHHSYAYSSSILLSFSFTASTTIFVYPISVSGTTLTGGTAATVATTGVSFVTGVLSNSRYALLYQVAGGGTGAVVSVSGTTASISSAATLLTVGTWNPQMQVFANQAFILSGTAGSDQISVLTDTAGTASVGTPVTVPAAGSFVGYLSTSKVFFSGGSAGQTNYYQYGISSNNPILEKSFPNVTSTSVIVTAVPLNFGYVRPLSGLPQSGSSNQSLILRTSAGKQAPANTQNPFTASVDGTYPAKLQQTANPYTSYNDGISDAVVWGIPSSQSATTTTVQLRKVTLV